VCEEESAITHHAALDSQGQYHRFDPLSCEHLVHHLTAIALHATRPVGNSAFVHCVCVRERAHPSEQTETRLE